MRNNNRTPLPMTPDSSRPSSEPNQTRHTQKKERDTKFGPEAERRRTRSSRRLHLHKSAPARHTQLQRLHTGRAPRPAGSEPKHRSPGSSCFAAGVIAVVRRGSSNLPQHTAPGPQTGAPPVGARFPRKRRCRRPVSLPGTASAALSAAGPDALMVEGSHVPTPGVHGIHNPDDSHFPNGRPTSPI